MRLRKKRAAAVIVAAFVFAAVAVAVHNASEVDVCIDPGHGGYDVGAEYDGRYEKDDNLEVSLLVEDELEKLGIKTYVTRSEDEYLSLSKRCSKANWRRAKLFVSIHRNSAVDAAGVEIWVHSEEPETDTALAQNILAELEKSGISKNRGVKFGYAREDGKNYYVNSHTDMPSCLVELGFITSQEDNELLDKNIEKYAAAIAAGIEKTFEKFCAED